MQDKDRALVEAEKSTVGWILEWAGEKRSYYALSVALAILNVAFKIIPYFLIGQVIAALLSGERDTAFYVTRIALVAASFVAAEIFHSFSTGCSHKATFTVLATIRKRCLDKLARVPLGYVKDTPSGTFKNIIVERVDSIETTLAHILPEFTSNLLAPLARRRLPVHRGLACGAAVVNTHRAGVFGHDGDVRRLRGKLQEYSEMHERAERSCGGVYQRHRGDQGLRQGGRLLREVHRSRQAGS